MLWIPQTIAPSECVKTTHLEKLCKLKLGDPSTQWETATIFCAIIWLINKLRVFIFTSPSTFEEQISNLCAGHFAGIQHPCNCWTTKMDIWIWVKICQNYHLHWPTPTPNGCHIIVWIVWQTARGCLDAGRILSRLGYKSTHNEHELLFTEVPGEWLEYLTSWLSIYYPYYPPTIQSYSPKIIKTE